MSSGGGTLQSPSRGRLLLVEDDRPTYNALKGILSRRGWEVIVSTTLSEAVGRLNESFSAVILDLMLPDGEGENVLREIRERGLPCRVIITTGSNDPTRLGAITRLRPQAMLKKPIDLTALEQALG